MFEGTQEQVRQWWHGQVEQLERAHYSIIVGPDEVVQLLVRSVCNKPIHICQDEKDCECNEWVETWYALYHALPQRKRLKVDQLITAKGEFFPWNGSWRRW